MDIAIVIDNKTISSFLFDMLSKLPQRKVVWTGQNGESAIKKCAEKTPDLILMSIEIASEKSIKPILHIMQKNPCSIVILTSSINDNMSKVFEAMGQGALDVVNLNFTHIESDDSGCKTLFSKIDTIEKLIGKGTKAVKNNSIKSKESSHHAERHIPPLLILGASTGGPSALAKIISKFPVNANFATVIIQHVDAKFSSGLARWLGEQTPLPVKVARAGSHLSKGEIYITGQNEHLVLTPEFDFKYSKYPLDIIYKPSVDVFFESVALNWPDRSVAVLLTGMGNDGAAGLKKLQELGWYTIAEDQSSCVVFGMPRAAINLGAANEILEIDQIAPNVLSYLKLKG